MQKSHQSMQNLLSNRMPPQRLYFLHQISDGLELKKFKQGSQKWTSKKTAHSLPVKARQNILPARYASIPCLKRPIPHAHAGASVTFEPGARSAWHTHPLGQTLIVTSGCGWVQSEGGAKTEIRPGDIVWCPPKEKHWHGATKTTAMTHIAIQEALDGKVVEWMEKVSDEQYQA